MFGFGKKDPKAKLQREYEQLLAAALEKQRNGDIESYSRLSQKAEALLKQLDASQSTG